MNISAQIFNSKGGTTAVIVHKIKFTVISNGVTNCSFMLTYILRRDIVQFVPFDDELEIRLFRCKISSYIRLAH